MGWPKPSSTWTGQAEPGDAGRVAGGNAARRAAARESRRAEAAALLRLTAATCQYGAAQLSDGLTPEQAQSAALEAAEELENVAASLRRLTRLGEAQRRALAVELASLGLSTQQIGRQLGLSDKTVRYYARGLRSTGEPWAG